MHNPLTAKRKIRELKWVLKAEKDQLRWYQDKAKFDALKAADWRPHVRMDGKYHAIYWTAPDSSKERYSFDDAYDVHIKTKGTKCP